MQNVEFAKSVLVLFLVKQMAEWWDSWQWELYDIIILFFLRQTHPACDPVSVFFSQNIFGLTLRLAGW